MSPGGRAACVVDGFLWSTFCFTNASYTNVKSYDSGLFCTASLRWVITHLTWDQPRVRGHILLSPVGLRSFSHPTCVSALSWCSSAARVLGLGRDRGALRRDPPPGRQTILHLTNLKASNLFFCVSALYGPLRIHQVVLPLFRKEGIIPVFLHLSSISLSSTQHALVILLSLPNCGQQHTCMDFLLLLCCTCPIWRCFPAVAWRFNSTPGISDMGLFLAAYICWMHVRPFRSKNVAQLNGHLKHLRWFLYLHIFTLSHQYGIVMKCL